MCSRNVYSHSPVSKSQSLMEASSLEVAICVYTGWNRTCVILALCPINFFFSGSLGIASPDCFARAIRSYGLRSFEPSANLAFIIPPFSTNSFSIFYISIAFCSFVSFNYLHAFSSSITCFFNRAIDVHFLSRMSFNNDTGVLEFF